MPRPSCFLIGLILVLPSLCLFGPACWQGRSFAFRDTSRYYYPLYAWAHHEWRSGRIPLWNDRENLGTPTHADPTASIFYPGQWVFALPLAYPTAFRLYVLGHVGLAVACSYIALRGWRVSRRGAVVGALTYAYSGAVLFNYCNVTFLVGAAWFPLGMLLLQRLLACPTLPRACALGTILALTVLGGDPQAAFHTMLLGAIFIAVRAVPRDASRAILRRPLQIATQLARQSARDWIWFSVAIGFAGALAAIQVLPTWTWYQSGIRRSFDEPRTIYEFLATDSSPFQGAPDFPEAKATRWWNRARALLDHPRPGSHEGAIYQFSVGPWRLVELLWPNVSGRIYPLNQRWTRAIPGESRIWTPSLYLGILPLLLAFYRARWLKGRAHIRWLAWTAVFSIVASFGYYGAGWLLHEWNHWRYGTPAAQAAWGAPVGGLYWMLVTLVPGYAGFRYPAKWLVITAWALSALAAHGWDVAWRQRTAAISRALAGLVILSSVALVAFPVVWSPWRDWVTAIPGDEIFGPLNVPGAATDILRAFSHSVIVAGLGWWLWRSAPRRWAAHALILLLAADLTLAHAWFILTVPDDLLTRRRPVDAVQETANSDPIRYYQFISPETYPEFWRTHSSDKRAAEYVTWEIASRIPRWPLLNRGFPTYACIDSPGSDQNADYEAVLQTARNNNPIRDGRPHLGVLAVLGVRETDTPRPAADPSSALPHRPTPTHFAKVAAAFPRAWIVRDLEIIPPLSRRSTRDLESRTAEVYFPGGRLRDFKRTAIIEADEFPVGTIGGKSDTAHRETKFPNVSSRGWDRVAWESRSPGELTLEVELAGDGLLVINDLYAPGWRAYLATYRETPRSEPIQKVRVPMWRTNRIMRGVWLPPGRHRVDLVYYPVDFYLGAGISTAALAMLVAVASPKTVSRMLSKFRLASRKNGSGSSS